jgi:Fur family ferric uptake transcriptional regulator
MADAGEVDVIRTPEGEAAYRRCSEGHHHHLVCRSCGFSVEIEATFVESWAAQVAAQYGFTDTGHELELFGLCRECGQRSK